MLLMLVQVLSFVRGFSQLIDETTVVVPGTELMERSVKTDEDKSRSINTSTRNIATRVQDHNRDQTGNKGHSSTTTDREGLSKRRLQGGMSSNATTAAISTQASSLSGSLQTRKAGSNNTNRDSTQGGEYDLQMLGLDSSVIRTPAGDNILHIVKTRFMQHQPDLVELGLARLRLFETFTLPSMEAQSDRSFLWLIQTDPALHESIKAPFLQTIRNSSVSDRIVVLGQNTNAGSFHGTHHFDGSKDVWHGSVSRFRNAVLAVKEKQLAVMETTLDADDALPKDFMQYIHTEGREQLRDRKDWMYWCSHYHLEWQVAGETTEKNNADTQSVGEQPTDQRLSTTANDNAVFRTEVQSTSFGYVRPRHASKCITAGLTVLFGREASRSDLPGVMVHTRIENMILPCDQRDLFIDRDDDDSGGSAAGAAVVAAGVDDNTNDTVSPKRTWCVQSMYEDRPGALRARTPTSTGMSQVNIPMKSNAIAGRKSGGQTHKRSDATDKHDSQSSPEPPSVVSLWDSIETRFGMDRWHVRDTKDILIERIGPIAAENLRGQCTKGHSCKEETREMLRQLSKQR